MSSEQAAHQAPVVCVVVRRGRFLVADRFFEPGSPLTLGRRGAVPAREGALVAVLPERGRGRILEELGSPEDARAVLRGLLVEAGVARPFPDEAMAEARIAAREPDGLDPDRIDLRDLTAITVDPPGAKDFDDALSLRREGDGLRVWVHIADVAFHVRAGGALDAEARRRALSVYVPGQVEPMLPHELSSGACSLQEGRDRRAISMELLFDGDMRPGEPVFYRSLIRSDARLTYIEAHAILEGRAHDERAGETLELADRLAAALRERRMARGALAIDPLELELELEGPDVVEAHLMGEPRAHALVEELMILANEQVAEHLQRVRRPALYRIHEPPEPEAIEGLFARYADLGVPTVPVPETMGPQEAAAVVTAQSALLRRHLAERRTGRSAFTSLLLRSLKQARYSPANVGHMGLASPAYAHFTSPIRRYPDLVVHRALMASLGGDEQVSGSLEAIGDHASITEREGTVVERRADDLCLAWLLARRSIELGPAHAFPGEVAGLIGAGAFVRFGDVFEGFLPARRLARGDRYDLNELGTALVARASGRRLRLGDPVEVAVTDIDVPRGRVTLDLPGNLVEDDRPPRKPNRQRPARQPRPTPRRRRRT